MKKNNPYQPLSANDNQPQSADDPNIAAKPAPGGNTIKDPKDWTWPLGAGKKERMNQKDNSGLNKRQIVRCIRGNWYIQC